jgi:hypothetical protein
MSLVLILLLTGADDEKVPQATRVPDSKALESCPGPPHSGHDGQRPEDCKCLWQPTMARPGS